MLPNTEIKTSDNRLVSKKGYPPIYVIVPSLDGDVDALIHIIQRQSYRPTSVEVVKGIQPNGLARNNGVSIIEENLSPGEDCILVFIDDDANPESTTLLESLVSPLIEDRIRKEYQIGITGVARVLPENATWFQRRVAFEIPRMVNEIPKKPLRTNPPINGYGHSLITTTCCAMWFSTFIEAGRFSDELVSGVDTDLFYRIRRLGYEFLMVGNEYVTHPPPSDPFALVRKFFWYGRGYGQEVQGRPGQNLGPRLPTTFHRILFILAASVWFLPNIFILYSYSYPHLELGFRPLKALSTYAVAWGYNRSWISGD